jgi:hypothetical protein
MPKAADRSHLPGLERPEASYRKEWMFQRLGWAALGLFLLAAALGLLGPGGLSRAQAGGPALQVSYDRFGRREADLQFTALSRPPSGGHTLRLAFSAECLRDAEMRWIRQEPDSAVAGEQGGVTYVFRRDPAAAQVEVEWTLKPEFAGSRACQLASEGARAGFKQWIWP